MTPEVQNTGKRKQFFTTGSIFGTFHIGGINSGRKAKNFDGFVCFNFVYFNHRTIQSGLTGVRTCSGNSR